jgi:hypothetical protein
MKILALENGKYELRFDETSGALCAYRHGEPWQDFTGSKFIYLLMQAALETLDQAPQPIARMLIWRGPSNYQVPPPACRTYTEFPESEAYPQNKTAYWENSTPLYPAPAK